MSKFKIFKNKGNYVETVKDGFSWPALLFGIFWILYKKMYIVLLLSLILGLFLVVISIDYPELDIVTNFAIPVLLGVFGNRIFEDHLIRKGYSIVGEIEATSKSEALIAYGNMSNKKF